MSKYLLEEKKLQTLTSPIKTEEATIPSDWSIRHMTQTDALASFCYVCGRIKLFRREHPRTAGRAIPRRDAKYIGKERTNGGIFSFGRIFVCTTVSRIDRNVRTSGFKLNQVTADVESLKLVELSRRRQSNYRHSVGS